VISLSDLYIEEERRGEERSGEKRREEKRIVLNPITGPI
jgi:hypothetical protein